MEDNLDMVNEDMGNLDMDNQDMDDNHGYGPGKWELNQFINKLHVVKELIKMNLTELLKFAQMLL